ncbi:MAG: 23S rRNA (adenine(2503)-C(2))-methyltransferase RlmN [Lachnospiraceae bacterium]|uniref:23S rRNA (adenine(2503)-C(2))-methyltransferase RlmN n=1 Tax=Candidatus Merdisoma sp. JLR.KK011 TaxID=3114299 RepID=UPI0014348B18|nr:23S rRNA (adenine(2503)-C(2))-methyltransferase RlmN [Lachnospiraceae bacterium]MCI9251683.1 23S rRNA (adenine(2503)-C(2))-methyltransferase RlmN [Lachnospiraceae bacterium]MCI9383798.1 23S rRNA (adenine(2503)-C(2))-methyltransferase RlmN [Lachnospiraceae bacterium]MCI9478539.1 23S rRNA (adenine(2503)-C(2))-methyltransferase RlmN [Lachnospiraceae bacterium]MCI9624109.1 23S rRNA (adenine(2503)-C(2))-methyltransferase RlmN [Lachnospiraceae bacterium]
MEQTDIKSLTLTELWEEFQGRGEKAFRADQVYQWMHEKLAEDISRMSNLPKAFREWLEKEYEYVTLEIVEIQRSKLDGTCKYLFRLPDGHVIESVLMRYRHGNSVCISSQAGCRMGCRFCASAIGGLKRNLRPSEMLEQIYRIQQDCGERVSNVVVMGTGEPLDNYDNLVRFIRLLSHEKGLNISQRSITVSTCGIVPGIRALAEEELSVTLALSLHAVTQEKRRELMPIANRYELKEVLDACGYYFQKTGRRLTFEYSLVQGVNDSREDAKALAALAGPLHAHVNLIPVNPVTERDFVQPGEKIIDNFKKNLEKCGINATLRREMGRDIDGACGQLRRKYLKGGE